MLYNNYEQFEAADNDSKKFFKEYKLQLEKGDDLNNLKYIEKVSNEMIKRGIPFYMFTTTSVNSDQVIMFNSIGSVFKDEMDGKDVENGFGMLHLNTVLHIMMITLLTRYAESYNMSVQDYSKLLFDTTFEEDSQDLQDS